MRSKRDLAELTEGFDALAKQRAGKRTLRTHTEGHIVDSKVEHARQQLKAFEERRREPK